MRPILNYHGGKWKMKKWIIENLPEHDIYIEPFGGGASVLLGKPVSRHEVYNDLDENIFNVFFQYRNNSDILVKKLESTPYSRREYDYAHNAIFNCEVEKARCFIIRSFMGIGDSIYKKTGFRNSVTCNTSLAKSFKNYVDASDFFIKRLRYVILENLDYEEIFNKYDKPGALFYVDPPYLHETRTTNNSYKYEMSDYQHKKLIEILNNIEGSFVLSGYDNLLYDKYLQYSKKIYKEVSTQKSSRKECLWIKT